MNNYGLDNAAGLAEIVARHPQVERILCGHLHRAIDRRFELDPENETGG
jgi:3',5'-cyclic AMP phosphodiesterase CpdA